MLYAPHLGPWHGHPDMSAAAESCGRTRPFPTTSRASGAHPVGPEPSDGVKLTYILLIQRTLKARPRWVVDSMAELANQRGTSLKTFRKHCDALSKFGFIETIPYRVLSDDYNMNEHAILLLNLPGWCRTPAERDGKVDDEDSASFPPRRAVDLGKVALHRVKLRALKVTDAA